MRKIEQQMIAAIKGNTDWKCDNTAVMHSPGNVINGPVSHVYLHGCLLYTSDAADE